MGTDEARPGDDADARVECPRCPAPIAPVDVGDLGDGPGWSCPEHGVVAPLWRPARSSYDAFAAHLGRAGAFPTFLPWPLGPGWSVADFASVVADGAGVARATMAAVAGTSQLDGPVEVAVVSEEPATGFGARVAGLSGPEGSPLDPGPEIGEGPPSVWVRVEAQSVGLWPVSVSDQSGEWDRSVLVGEAQGRWLWIVLRPASAVLLLRDDWILRDVSDTGPHLVALPFGGQTSAW